jgi:hypothetical protein
MLQQSMKLAIVARKVCLFYRVRTKRQYCLLGNLPIAAKVYDRCRYEHLFADSNNSSDLLAKCGFQDVDAWLSRLFTSGARPDDLLDACACAIAADSPVRKLECKRESDARGLHMEMWF